jgi:phage tail P2-like protein
MPDKIQSISLKDLVPDSIKDDQRVAAAIAALDAEIRKVSALCEVPRLFSRLDTLSSDVLDHLAWQLQVDIWRSDLPVGKKRDLIRIALAIHRKKGTPWAVEQAMAAVGVPIGLEEWWEYGGDPYYFRVRVQAIADPLSREAVLGMMSNIEAYKNVRSWGSLRLAQEGDMWPLFCRMGLWVKPETMVLPYILSVELTDSQYCFFSGTHITRGRVMID